MKKRKVGKGRKSSKPKKKSLLKEYDRLVRNNIVFGSGVVVSLMVLAMTVIMFAVPPAGQSLEASISLLSVLTYPLVVVISILLSLILSMYGKVREGLVVSYLPLVNISFYFLSLLGLLIRCGGKVYC